LKTVDSSLDWSEVEREINMISSQLSIFSKDFQKIKTNLYSNFTVLSRLEVECRRTKNKNVELKKQLIIDRINQDLSTIQQIYLMGLLSK
jgi:hypothetical protein